MKPAALLRASDDVPKSQSCLRIQVPDDFALFRGSWLEYAAAHPSPTLPDMPPPSSESHSESDSAAADVGDWLETLVDQTIGIRAAGKSGYVRAKIIAVRALRSTHRRASDIGTRSSCTG